jgi:hypothetical protein
MTSDAMAAAWERVCVAVDLHRMAVARRARARQAYLSASGEIDDAARALGAAESAVLDAREAEDNARDRYRAAVAAERVTA